MYRETHSHNNDTSYSALGCFIITFILFLPNTDAFVASLSTNKYLYGFGLVDPERIERDYQIFSLVTFLGILVFTVRRLPRSLLLYTTTALLTFASVWNAVVTAIYADERWTTSIRSHGVFSLLILPIAILVFASDRMNYKCLQCISAALYTTCIIKVLYSINAYRKDGGVTIANGIESLAADGSMLQVICLTSLIAYTLGVYMWQSQRKKQAMLQYSYGIAMLVTLGISFRRTQLIQFILAITTASLLKGWLNKRLLSTLWKAGAMLLSIASIAYVSGYVYFGKDVVIDRLLSLSSQAYAKSDSAESNDEYIDHWRRVPQILQKSNWLGTGLDLDYVHLGPYTEVSGPIPLHLGSYELLVSVGAVGTLVWFLCFVYTPIIALHCAKATRGLQLEIVCLSAGYIFYTGLFPFGSPIYYSTQWILITGGFLGLLIKQIACKTVIRSSNSSTSTAGNKTTTV
jgi:hypothetical protein